MGMDDGMGRRERGLMKRTLIFSVYLDIGSWRGDERAAEWWGEGSLVIQVKEELVVQTFNVFVRRDDGLKVLVLCLSSTSIAVHSEGQIACDMRDREESCYSPGDRRRWGSRPSCRPHPNPHLPDVSVFRCPLHRIWHKTHLENSFLHINPNTLPVHTFPRLADKAELKVDADLLARLFGELAISIPASYRERAAC
jgi:hypothetical protein